MSFYCLAPYGSSLKKDGCLLHPITVFTSYILPKQLPLVKQLSILQISHGALEAAFPQHF